MVDIKASKENPSDAPRAASGTGVNRGRRISQPAIGIRESNSTDGKGLVDNVMDVWDMLGMRLARICRYDVDFLSVTPVQLRRPRCRRS